MVLVFRRGDNWSAGIRVKHMLGFNKRLLILQYNGLFMRMIPTRRVMLVFYKGCENKLSRIIPARWLEKYLCIPI